MAAKPKRRYPVEPLTPTTSTCSPDNGDEVAVRKRLAMKLYVWEDVLDDYSAGMRIFNVLAGIGQQ